MTGTPITKRWNILHRENRRQSVTLWGRPHIVTPCLIPGQFGDGLHLVWISPTMHRPNFYLAFIDSKWELSNWAESDDHFCDHTDEIQDRVEDYFGRAHETYEDSLGRTRHRHNYFPANILDDGCAWGSIARFTRF